MSYREDAINKALRKIAKIHLDGGKEGEMREVLSELYGARVARTEDDEYDLVSLDIAESCLGVQIGKGVLRTHGQNQCAGPLAKNGKPICCIHNPSDHHMLSWPQNWRDDKGMMERLCPHNIGHPDPDDLKVRTTQWAGAHGCDGCCQKLERTATQ